ncbi:mitochondrial fusion and transport protein ugo1 [Scheffersomyces spartinae]|uniref:Mitochondrial fusion and transport protein ugo1 n=1 Tax=Scheffersomyces spartinae TaxID=45513 RepID=A0A9P7VDJ8_9ASCO|nr:mitochondrial fusion and transport protein ugo1 [Scheffersomyces spartinae]KAG7195533.1 mitochondrial fusion and transport protein ugo1 [Scheffersomyces spartinae]
MSGSNLNLRPYYDHDTFDAGYSVIFKPGVGLINMQDGKPITTTVINLTSAIGLKGLGALEGRLLAGDKNYAYDLELQEYFDTNNLTELFKNLIYSFIRNYCKFLFIQPLEITRLVLQVGKFEGLKKKQVSVKPRLLSRLDSGTDSDFDHNDDALDDDNDDTEEINYFQSTTNEWNDPTINSNSNSIQPIKSPMKRKSTNKTPRDVIQPVSKHTVDVLTALVTKDGPLALFRAINANFLYQTLNHTIEAWITGFISPFLGIPDPFFLDLTHSNDPFKSLCLSVAGCVMTGLVLMPLDLIRVKLMLTQFNTPHSLSASTSTPSSTSTTTSSETTSVSTSVSSSVIEHHQDAPPQKVNTRSIRECIRHFPAEYLLKPPAGVTILTVLYLLSSTLFRKMTPYVLYIKFNVDSYSSPNVYTVVNFLSLILEFFIKLPLENLLRKEQVRFLLANKPTDKEKVISIKKVQMIVDFNDVWKTNDDTDALSSDSTLLSKIKCLGLFNGWRVGVLNVIGFYGYNILKSNGADFREERL